jgi:hypothetical protein
LRELAQRAFAGCALDGTVDQRRRNAADRQIPACDFSNSLWSLRTMSCRMHAVRVVAAAVEARIA